ncbi:MAG: hypothetical protein HZB59_04325 [Ignavibacteriales bacterium]|nr:hypothetical protein [Ignavibacteriales bacterium]
MPRTTLYILISIFIIVALHGWAAIYPSHANWGFHFWGFYEKWIAVSAIGLVLLCSIPKIQSSIINNIDRFARAIRRLPWIVIFGLTSGIIIIAIYFFPAKLHLLGDGAVLLRSVPSGIMGDEITLSFRNQPLMFWIYRLAMKLHPFESAPNPYTVYYTIDIVAFLCFLALVFWSLRSSQQPFVERVLLGCFFAFAGGSQFFFGYVENYVLLYVATTTYLITGWLALEKRISIIVPILCFILMVLLHFGSLVFLPSLLLLLIFKWKKKRIIAIGLIAGIGIIGISMMYFIGFNLMNIIRPLRSGSVDFLQPFIAEGGNFPYAMFSFAHLLDWFNAIMLVAPFGLFLTIILIPALSPEKRWNNPIFLFLLTAVFCGIFFTWVINSALGLARDWDLFASFFVPLIVLPIYLLLQPLEIQLRRNILFLIALVSILHTAPWIGVNASAEKHLTRMQMLNSSLLLSKTAQLVHSEALANYFFDNQRYADARSYYELYMVIDSANPRIIGNISDVYRKLGEKEKYFYQLKRAAEANSPDPGIYSNLGVEYATRGDTLKAIEFNERAIQMNGNSSRAHANLGILYSAKNDFATADKHFRAAIDLGMREPLLFLYAGDCATRVGDLQRAITNYDTYLLNNPNDKRLRALRDKMYEYLSRGKK